MEQTKNALDYAPIAPRAMNVELAAYVVLRALVGALGALIFAATLFFELAAPDLAYLDEVGPPPPLRARLPTIFVGVGLGALLCVPHRWTPRGPLFGCRVALYFALAILTTWRAAGAFGAGLAGGRSWHIFPASLLLACVGVTLPVCLLWSRRIYRPLT